MGTTEEDVNSGSMGGWIEEHERRLHSIYKHAREQLEAAAECGGHQNQPNMTTVLEPDTLVNKIQDSWDSTAYEVVRNLKETEQYIRCVLSMPPWAREEHPLIIVVSMPNNSYL